MRELSERIREGRVDLADGIRVEHNGGWAQFVPDPDEPLFHIYAEGATSAQTAEILNRYRALFEEVIQSAAP
jgi:mannose-1-phosphate guanylyltransferase/phosphomannomutase